MIYGWRGRIGLLVPATNTTMEPEFNQIAPKGVSVHTARIPTEREATLSTLRQMEVDSHDAARRIAQCQPDVVVYGCTSGSFLEGAEYNTMICRELSDITGVPTVTTAGAMAASLVAGNLRRIDVVSPYVAVTNERLIAFLGHYGIEVLNLGTFDMLDQFAHAEIEPEAIYQKVRETVTPESEGVFIACTQLQAMGMAEMLEQDLHKPVYTATQASAWQAFTHLGVDPGIRNMGSLFRRLSVPVQEPAPSLINR